MAGKEEPTTEQLRRGLLEILDDAMQLEGAAFGKIRVARPDSGALEVAVQRGFSDEFIEAYREIAPDDPTPSAKAARLRRRVAVPDLTKQPADEYLNAVQEEGVHAMQATPIVASDGTVVGTLATHFDRAYHVSMSAAIVLDHFARRAAELIESGAAG